MMHKNHLQTENRSLSNWKINLYKCMFLMLYVVINIKEIEMRMAFSNYSTTTGYETSSHI
jgi:hypothetical protein